MSKTEKMQLMVISAEIGSTIEYVYSVQYQQLSTGLDSLIGGLDMCRKAVISQYCRSHQSFTGAAGRLQLHCDNETISTDGSGVPTWSYHQNSIVSISRTASRTTTKRCMVRICCFKLEIIISLPCPMYERRLLHELSTGNPFCFQLLPSRPGFCRPTERCHRSIASSGLLVDVFQHDIFL